MTAKETLRSIVEASAPNDREDAAIRRILSAELGLTIALCPPVVIDDAEPTANGDAHAPGFCVLRTDRRLTQVCESCLLSEVSLTT